MVTTIFKSIVTAVIFLACLAVLSSAVLAAMYKQIDKDGNVTYTDIPDKKNVKPIKPAPIMTFSAPSSSPLLSNNPRNQDSDGEDDEAKPATASVTYQSLSISSPENGAAVRANGGSFTVQLTLEPALDTNSKHRVVLLMDGETKGEGQSTSFTLANVDRGEHTLSAQIVSNEGDPLISAADVTVHVLRSFVSPPVN